MEPIFNKIDANDRSVREILDKKKYSIDVFQREYKWGRKQIEQLLADLETKFLSYYNESDERSDVRKYGRYYLGPIVLSMNEGRLSIIDGQQRLTSLTLLLIYLNNLQETDYIKPLIFSEKYGEKSFNLQIDDRKECIEALYEGGEYDPTDKGESVTNIVERYSDIQELFPDDLKGSALPYFIDWLIDNVTLVEIITYSDEDAYTIFETMNDRGLNLTPTEMLKGYLLSKIGNKEKKQEINAIWKKEILKLNEIGRDEDLEFFKIWLRAKYAETIRPGRKGAANEDFEKIGTRFHSWVRDNLEKVGLNTKEDFYRFVKEDLDYYVKIYLKIKNAEQQLQRGMEHLYYVAERGFTLRYPLLLAPIKKTDDEETIRKKLELVARFIETFIVYRSVNYRTLAYSSIRYTIYNLVKELRDKTVTELADILKKKIEEYDENLSGIKDFRLHNQNKRFVHFLLARITSHIETKSGMPSRFREYIDRELENPFQVEHIWANKYEEHTDEFDQKIDFEESRNMLGDLLLLPSNFNQSYGELPYEKKLPHYFGQNILAKTLNPQCYQNNPGFLSYKENSGLPFRAHEHFKKDDVRERQKLYQKICEEIWSPDGFDKIARS